MTNADFSAWVGARFKSRLAAARALGIDRDMLDAMMTGRRRKTGAPHPLPAWVDYMCAGFDTAGAAKARGESSQPRKARTRVDLARAQVLLDQMKSVNGAAGLLGVSSKALSKHIDKGALRKPYLAPPNARVDFDLAKAQEILDAGGTSAQAGAAVGVSRVRISQAMSHGLLRPSARMQSLKHRMSDSDLHTASGLLTAGATIRDVAGIVGFTTASLYHHIRNGRLPSPKKADS